MTSKSPSDAPLVAISGIITSSKYTSCMNQSTYNFIAFQALARFLAMMSFRTISTAPPLSGTCTSCRMTRMYTYFIYMRKYSRYRTKSG